MPLIKKASICSNKHHPYVTPTEQQEVPYRNYSRSLSHTAMNSSKQEQFVPRSMSAIDENTEGWKLSFCGVLPTAQRFSSASPETCGLSCSSPSSEFSSQAFLSSSQTTCEEKVELSPLSSTPIPVPMRNSRKRKSNFRSSGGYFFDKYMKRFRAKYGSQNKARGLEHSETIDELKTNKCAEQRRAAILKASMRSNRQDMVFTEPHNREDINLLCDSSCCNIEDVLDDDDLYPLRFGSSSQWISQSCNSPQHSVSNEVDMEVEQLKVNASSVSVFPSSPPRFWGDANCCDLDDVYAQPVSPVPSITDAGEPSCRYSDSNSETLKAMETLYLCNFQVAVEGDWLCLKEICDDGGPPNVLIASTLKDEIADVGVDEAISNGDVKSLQEMKVERRNLLGMAKLSVKSLIESSLSAGHTLDSDHEPLQQFFVITEYVLRHGLKTPKNFFTQNKYFWPPLEAVEKLCPDACEITNSVRSLPGIRTHLGRGRAWLRLALMQKKLADYFKVFIENREILKEWYEDGALVLNDEAVVLLGHLVGLNCIDANLCMKGDDLDNQVTVIDYSMYMKDGNRNFLPDEQEEESTMRKLVDQKNYLEERNRHLETTSSELQRKTELLELTNHSLQTELDAVKIQLETLKGEKERVISEKNDITVSHQKALEDREKDLDTERETLRQSRAGLDEMYTQIQKQLKHETNMRLDVEKELQLQMSLKQELEMAMKLLEKDIYDKQDGLITLREQLDNVKAINIDIYQKLQAKTLIEEEKNKDIQTLQSETETLAKQVSKLKNKLEESLRQTDVAREQADRYNQQLDDSEKKRSVLVTNLQIEREWRQALQAEVEERVRTITMLQEKVEMMVSLKEELNHITLEREDLKETCREQELTITDLAGHLGRSKQDLGDLKEVHKSITGNTWEKDEEVKMCVQCEKPFSISRRRHHCRNCGQIFCNACSDNTMPLASSAKPVRVCDVCHTTLLQRFSAGTA